MGIYIKGAGVISIQEPLSEEGVFHPLAYTTPQVRCMEPEFRKYIDPMAARRMSRIVKRAVVSAAVALENSGISMPDAIISGTGLGCVEDTEKFLDAMVRQGEYCLQPTFFIQSTHNTISSQIAIRLKCRGYNNTHVHRGISFESALLDAWLLFAKGQIHSALVGGYDELTPTYFRLLGRLGYWRETVTDSLQIVRELAEGTFAGEGSVCFALSDESTGAWGQLEGVSIAYRCPDFMQAAEHFLACCGIGWEGVDVVMTGLNGDRRNDAVYRQLQLPDAQKRAVYKPVCGEFFTAPAYGMYVAAVALKNGVLPASLSESGAAVEGIRRILLLNHWDGKDYSFILLSSCGN